MRLSDVYYTTDNLAGVPEVPGKPTPINFYQGEDIVMDVYLNYDDKPITDDKWDIVGTVKKNAYAQLVLWEGKLNNGLYKQKPEGFYRFIIPSESTATFLAGTYWLSVMIHEKTGAGPKVLDLVILNQPFSINYSASSPYPGNALDKSGVEQTVPVSIQPDKI